MAKTGAGSEPRVPGVAVNMDGAEWTVPPLTLPQYLRLLPKIKAATGPSVPDDAVLPTLIEVVWTAIQRNYPHLTQEAVSEMLDLGNMLPAFVAALSRDPTSSVAPLVTAPAANSLH